jgi:predicted enzyme related to lactoylglutathione lyase
MPVDMFASRFVLAVKDLRISTDYYMNVLGFIRDFGDESDGWSFLSRGSFRVMIGHCPDILSAGEVGDHSYYAYINVDNVDELYSEITAKGAETISLVATKPWGQREFGIKTPDGHRIMFGKTIAST